MPWPPRIPGMSGALMLWFETSNLYILCLSELLRKHVNTENNLYFLFLFAGQYFWSEYGEIFQQVMIMLYHDYTILI